MRDKGRAVLTVKDKEHAILAALGHRGLRHIEDCDCNGATGTIDGRCIHVAANLSDPGVFWPLFEEWVSRGDVGYVHSGGIGLRSFAIRSAKTFEVLGSHMAESTTEAGINAWFSALSALGKIREG